MASPFINEGKVWYVDPVNGDDAHHGKNFANARLTLQSIIDDKVKRGDDILIGPGSALEESVTIPRVDFEDDVLDHLYIRGIGGRGGAFIETPDADAIALTIHADDVTIENVGLAGSGTGSALYNTGRRTRLLACKLENQYDETPGGKVLRLGLGSVAQVTAGTHGKGDDLLIDDCELAYGDVGIMLEPSDRGAVTQVTLRNSRIHNMVAKHLDEVIGAGASADVSFRDLRILNNHFGRMEDGTEPSTAYIDLNGHADNTGEIVDNFFPTAIDGGKILLAGSAKLRWGPNKVINGWSTAAPS